MEGKRELYGKNKWGGSPGEIHISDLGRAAYLGPFFSVFHSGSSVFISYLIKVL